MVETWENRKIPFTIPDNSQVKFVELPGGYEQLDLGKENFTIVGQKRTWKRFIAPITGYYILNDKRVYLKEDEEYLAYDIS